MNRVPLSMYFGAMAIVGLVALLVTGPLQQSTGSSSIIRDIIDVLAIFITFMAGRRAKSQGRRYVGVGALIGGLYGGLSGASRFFITVTRAEFLSKFHGKTPPAHLVSESLRIANSPTLHAVEFLGSLIGGVVLGLIIGTLGSITTKRQNDKIVV